MVYNQGTESKLQKMGSKFHIVGNRMSIMPKQLLLSKHHVRQLHSKYMSFSNTTAGRQLMITDTSSCSVMSILENTKNWWGEYKHIEKQDKQLPAGGNQRQVPINNYEKQNKQLPIKLAIKNKNKNLNAKYKGRVVNNKKNELVNQNLDKKENSGNTNKQDQKTIVSTQNILSALNKETSSVQIVQFIQAKITNACVQAGVIKEDDNLNNVVPKLEIKRSKRNRVVIDDKYPIVENVKDESNRNVQEICQEHPSSVENITHVLEYQTLSNYYEWTKEKELNSVYSELSALKSELTFKMCELSEIKSELQSNVPDEQTIKYNLETRMLELLSMRHELGISISKENLVKDQVDSKMAELLALKDEVDSKVPENQTLLSDICAVSVQSSSNSDLVDSATSIHAEIIQCNVLGDTILPCDEIVSNNKIIPHDEIVPDDKTIPHDEIVPDDKTIPHDDIVPDNKTIPCDEILPDDKTIPCDEILLDDKTIPHVQDCTIMSCDITIPHDESVLREEIASQCDEIIQQDVMQSKSRTSYEEQHLISVQQSSSKNDTIQQSSSNADISETCARDVLKCEGLVPSSSFEVKRDQSLTQYSNPEPICSKESDKIFTIDKSTNTSNTEFVAEVPESQSQSTSKSLGCKLLESTKRKNFKILFNKDKSRFIIDMKKNK